MWHAWIMSAVHWLACAKLGKQRRHGWLAGWIAHEDELGGSFRVFEMKQELPSAQKKPLCSACMLALQRMRAGSAAHVCCLFTIRKVRVYKMAHVGGCSSHSALLALHHNRG